MTAAPVRDEKAEGRIGWPYTSFKSLINFFDRLTAANAVPKQIDRGVLGGSEAQKTQLMATLKATGLVGENGQVSDRLRRLIVADLKDRPAIIREMLAEKYPAATKLAEENGTTKQLEATFEPLGGDTLRKAMTFYIHASKFAQAPMSSFFKVPSGYTATRVKRKSTASGNGSTPAAPVAPAPTVTTDPKAAYLHMLMEKAKTSENLDNELLNRIERLLGFSEEGSE